MGIYKKEKIFSPK